MAESTSKATAAPVALGTVAAQEKVSKGARVFADVPNVERVSLADGRTGAIQRETRADGSHGPMVLAIVRVGNDGTESATRFSLADIQRVSDALGAHGVALVTPYSPPAK